MRGATDAVGGVVRTRKASLFSLIKQLLVQEIGRVSFFLCVCVFFFVFFFVGFFSLDKVLVFLLLN